MEIKSSIQSVTVYKDRAFIERAAQINLEAGEHLVKFCGLPLGIDPNSLQINGSLNAVLQDIKFKEVYLDEVPDMVKKDISDQIEEIESQIEEINDRINNTNLEKSFLQNLANVTGEPSKKSIIAMFLPDKLQEMLSFYNTKLNALDDSNREYNKEIKKLNNRLQILKHEHKKFNQKQLKAEKQVELKLDIQEEGMVNIILSYIVMNASWLPIYDLRLNSEEKKMKVAYNAIIKQNTGENWEDVKLKLSTARPQISALSPSLNTWYINVYQVQPPIMMTSNEGSGDREYAKRSLKAKGEAEEMMEEPVMKIPEAIVETGATSVIFSIPGTCSITDNNEEHKIGITNLEFAAVLEYNSVPKVTPFAYLTASALNNSDYPLLAGKTNVFLDNSFVSNSTLKLVAPNEEFKTSLGADEGINIEHKLINRFTKDEGLFSKKVKITFEYTIEIKNNKKINSLIKIKDQIPISQNQEIKIELIEPKYKEDTELFKKEVDGSLEWIQNIDAGEKCKLALKFSVEYPKDIRITGI